MGIDSPQKDFTAWPKSPSIFAPARCRFDTTAHAQPKSASAARPGRCEPRAQAAQTSCCTTRSNKAHGVHPDPLSITGGSARAERGALLGLIPPCAIAEAHAVTVLKASTIHTANSESVTLTESHRGQHCQGKLSNDAKIC